MNMKPYYQSIFLVVALMVAISPCRSEGNEAPTGVLLGLRNDTEDISTYRTLWITNESGKINVVKNSGILVPYGEGFWRIEGKWYEKEMYSNSGNSKIQMEYILAHPQGEKFSLSEKLRNYINSMAENWVQINESAKLTFVGQHYACIKQDNAYDSGGTLRPVNATAFVREIKDLNRSFENNEYSNNPDDKMNIPLEKIFGAAASPYLNNYRALKITEAEQDLFGGNPEVHNQTDEFGWGLVRKNGHWQPQLAKKWRFTNNSTAINSYQWYDLPLEVPKTLVGDDQTINLHELRKTIPNAVDGLASPGEDLWVVFTPGKLIIFTGKDFKDPVQLNISTKESLIMSQWCPGKEVSKWNEEFSEYQK